MNDVHSAVLFDKLQKSFIAWKLSMQSVINVGLKSELTTWIRILSCVCIVAE